MKKLILMISAFAAIAVACTNETKETPAVSFETALPIVAGEVATYTITVADYSGTDPVRIPVKFGGTAVKGTDYTVSAEEFVWGGTNPVTSIQVTTLVFDDSKTVSLSLELPEGWKAGNYPMSQSNLSAKLGYVSFERSSYGLTGTTEFAVSVYDGEGKLLTLENDAELAISVSSASTAVEATHFTLSTKTVKIPAGSSSANFTVSMVGDDAVADHDQFTLVLDPGAKFSIGNYNELTISIWGSAWAKLDGKWVMNEIVTTADVLEGMMYYSYLDPNAYVGFPELNSEDNIVFNISESKAIPDFKSTFKNYFIGESMISKGETHMVRLENMPNPPTADLDIIIFKNVNRFFAEDQISTDKEAYVGVRLIKDEDTQEDLLDMYIIDYESKSFINLEAMGMDSYMYNESKPVSDSPGMFLNATFKKATEN